MKQTKTNNQTPSIKLENVSKKFENLVAVNNVSFETSYGEIVALLGPNGAGKSTLMNMIAGYTTPSSGKIFVNGHNVDNQDLLTKKDIGFLPEGSPLYGDMSVQMFLQYFIELKLGSEDKKSDLKNMEVFKSELLRVMHTAKIENVATQKIETLSKGYTRRVGFAASLIGNPPILLLDEPTDGLDPNQKEHMRHLIKEMSKNKTIVVSTHLLDEAELLADKIILIDCGKIVISGSVADILSYAKKKTLAEAFKALTAKGEN